MQHKHKVIMAIVGLGTAQEHLVYIHYDEDHPSNPKPADQLTLKPKEKVRFTSDDGDFSVDFTASPFTSGDTHLAGLQGTLAPKPSQPAEIVKDIQPPPPQDPHFKYRAQVGTVWEDPEIIIDLSGGRSQAEAAKKPKKKTSAPKKKK